MNQGTHPEELPAEVLANVASVVGAEVTLVSRLPGGVNTGAMRVQLAGRADAVLKAEPSAHSSHLDKTLRGQRVVEHMRRRGYPTPAWLGVGATATHVWHLMDFVDAAPVQELTPALGVFLRGVGLDRAAAARMRRRPATTRGPGHGPCRSHAGQCPGP
jgi:hypothetical protein